MSAFKKELTKNFNYGEKDDIYNWIKKSKDDIYNNIQNRNQKNLDEKEILNNEILESRLRFYKILKYVYNNK